MSHKDLKLRVREDYRYIQDFRTRWSDNDMYDHMNNSIYNFLYDSVVNTYLIEECGLNPPTSSQYGLVVHSHRSLASLFNSYAPSIFRKGFLADISFSDFFGSIAFPAVAELALRVNKLGKSSVTYEIALFEREVKEVKSVGEIIHVFVDRDTGRPAVNGMNDSLKAGLQKILISQSKL